MTWKTDEELRNELKADLTELVAASLSDFEQQLREAQGEEKEAGVQQAVGIAAAAAAFRADPDNPAKRKAAWDAIGAEQAKLRQQTEAIQAVADSKVVGLAGAAKTANAAWKAAGSKPYGAEYETLQRANKAFWAAREAR